ncbi:ribosome small subunit-dependent GTPase A [Serpentinicella alkaliphila]|uniref:Small ribosomal subunit biogenesis GTPase RsgA n=1 Tax=Serpentinicella alkaliphila TaxID=1734049 RepID=A0A4R2TF19_9FIRM|nr:ribosome small subunit-dependent GTPase A [Serpentinicella alkaliphila]QUH26221.1 ribosome small subunit-dependent GTPase A [Serpentinicella alkaliphila]TCQ01681.1 ribosome biogenesis GTPase [Serpentinicella alkaliphila]
MKEGRLIKGIGGFYYVYIDGLIYECKARGIFRKKKITPSIGDFVRIDVIDEEKKLGVLEEILDRKNEMIRPPVSNIDQAFIVFSFINPDINTMLLDRFTVLAESKGLDVVICLNKTDLVKDEILIKELNEIYKNSGYKIIMTSTKENNGLEEIKNLLHSKTSVFAGPSGVGKSSILKILTNRELEIGDVSQKTGRGKHTTRHAELIRINSDGWVVDTPGFSSLDLGEIDSEELSDFFPEFREYMTECRFVSCSHVNEPDCMVKEALEEGKIALSRYENYKTFLKEIKESRRY